MKLEKLPKTIKIKLEDMETSVKTPRYIAAKTKDLRGFGYEGLTEAEVSEQLLRILNKEDLSVIGMFMKGDIILD